MNSEPRTAAARTGTAMIAASRQRTRQLLSDIRELVAERPRAAAGRAAVPGWPAAGAMAVPGAAACGPWGPRVDRELGSVSRLATAPFPVALPPARSPELPPSACLPLTDPGAVSPRFVPDRLRTTLAPRIGKPDLDVCRATTAQHPHPFPPQPSPSSGQHCSGKQGGRGHTLPSQNG